MVDGTVRVQRFESSVNRTGVIIATSFALNRGQRVNARFTGCLIDLNDPIKTYFEGRLVQKT